MTEPQPWATRAEFESWWRANVLDLNRLAAKDPPKYQRIADKIAGYLDALPKVKA